MSALVFLIAIGLVIAVVVLEARHRRRRHEAARYDTLDRVVAAISHVAALRRTGQDDHGVLLEGGALGGDPISVAVRRAPEGRITFTVHTTTMVRLALRRAGDPWTARLLTGDEAFDKAFVVETSDERAIRLLADADVRLHVRRLFRAPLLCDVAFTGTGRVLATAFVDRMNVAQVPQLLDDLARLAAAFTPTIRVKPARRIALSARSRGARCSFCHEPIQDDAPDIVACGECATLLHEACWGELGRCPVLGCAAGTSDSERVRV